MLCRLCVEISIYPEWMARPHCARNTPVFMHCNISAHPGALTAERIGGLELAAKVVEERLGARHRGCCTAVPI
jgi:hypothetical protein